MSTHTNLRRTIKALCAPAVIAMLAHVPVAQADVIARNAEYSYSKNTFTFSILKNQAQIFSSEQESSFGVPLVDGSPRPLQLVSVTARPESESGVLVSASPNRNCITVMVSPVPGQSGGPGFFSIQYVVSDGSSQASGNLSFEDAQLGSFFDPVNEESDGRCEDPQFTSSIANPDAAQTSANTPVTINVLGNDSVGGQIMLTRTADPRFTALSVTEVSSASVTADGRPVLQVAEASANGGSVQTNDDGTITYTPAPGFSGKDTFTYTIQDYNPEIGVGFKQLNPSATVTVDVEAAPQEDPAVITVRDTPVPNGTNLDIPDTDLVAGETVPFDGSSTMFLVEGTPQRSFQWFVGNSETPQGTEATFVPRLPDGLSQVRLVVTADLGEETLTATSTITVTVAPAVVTTTQATILVNNNPVVNGAFSLTDSDGKPGEQPIFDGSQSRLASGAQPTIFQWFVGNSETPQGTGPTFSPQLPDGISQVRLIVSDGQSSASSSVDVTVGGVITLADIPNLTPNQRSVAQALDNLCTQLEQRAAANPDSLTENQEDLQDRCRGILAAGTSDQVRALDELGAQDFNGARLQTLLFTNSLYAGVMDRLMALRGGVKGLSLAGLNLVIDGQSVPLAELERMFGQMLGGGAAADEPGSLLGDKWGAWSRGNFTFGDKDRSKNDKGFDADQFSLTAGLDYRLSDKMVIGGALAYGSSNLNYNPNDEGGLDTESWAVSIYGSRYAGKNFYFDALINAANSSYEAHRRIGYNEAAFDAGGNVIGTQTVQRDARGDTDGLTLSGGLSGGYDFIYKGFTFSPNLGVFYVDSKIDQFREGGSRGLNLIYDEQTFQSLTGTLGLRVNYAWNVSWGVLVPYFRSDYVREFKKDVEAFNVRFANDPADPAPPIVVQSDSPDQSYVRLVGGISGQFPFGISGYVEYQRLQSFEFVDFNDLSMGLRVQYRY